eukprot:5248809-Karenia_brevis.AAC.1
MLNNRATHCYCMSQDEMAALMLITSSDKPCLTHLIGQWRVALPLPNLLACWTGRAEAMMPPLDFSAR